MADIIERTLIYDGGTKFIILASAPEGDAGGKATEANFFRLAALYPSRVYFNNTFNQPLSKLILAGGDFTLIPSRFEPCGLVDYEASLVGNIVIGRATGGLTKVRHCAYLYEWLDISDRAGEANAFFGKSKPPLTPIVTISPSRSIDPHRYGYQSSWDASAAQYMEMYRYGLLAKKWRAERRQLIDKFIHRLKKERAPFAEFFIPGTQEYTDRLDWELKQALS